MKVAFINVMALVAIGYFSMWCCLGYFALFILAVSAVRRGVGDRLALPVLQVANWGSRAVCGFWFVLVAAVLEVVLGTRLAWTVVDEEGQVPLEAAVGRGAGLGEAVTSEDVCLRRVLTPPSAPGKAKVVIMNHHCRLDWLYFFLFIARALPFGAKVHVVMKGELRRVPCMGWGMQCFRFLFLTRKWEKDEAYLRQMTEFNRTTRDRNIVFLFPEGTDLSLSNIEKSQAFAAREGLPTYRHVLNPRTTGLVALGTMLGGAADLEEIVDLTVGYTYFSPGERPAEPSLLSGRQAPKVHLLVRRCGVEGNPLCPAACRHPAPVEDEERFKQWTHDRFTEKEQLMSRFMANNPVGFDHADVRAVYGQHCGLLTYDEDADRLAHPGVSKLQRHWRQMGTPTMLGMLLAFFVIPLLLFWLGPAGWLLGARRGGLLRGFLAFNVYLVLSGVFVKLATVACGGDLQDLWVLKKTPEDESWLARWRARKARKD